MLSTATSIPRDGRPGDASHVGVALDELVADPDGVGFVLWPRGADLDVVATRAQVLARKVADTDVTRAGGRVEQRVEPVGGVVAARAIVQQRVIAAGGV